MTDEYPPDHAHQNGIFLAHTKTELKGVNPISGMFWAVRFV